MKGNKRWGVRIGRSKSVCTTIIFGQVAERGGAGDGEEDHEAHLQLQVGADHWSVLSDQIMHWSLIILQLSGEHQLLCERRPQIGSDRPGDLPVGGPSRGPGPVLGVRDPPGIGQKGGPKNRKAENWRWDIFSWKNPTVWHRPSRSPRTKSEIGENKSRSEERVMWKCGA